MSGGLSTVAVRTTNLTLCDFGTEPEQGSLAPNQPCHPLGLIPEVVELQNDGVRFTTVHAKVSLKELQNEPPIAIDVRLLMKAVVGRFQCGGS